MFHIKLLGFFPGHPLVPLNLTLNMIFKVTTYDFPLAPLLSKRFLLKKGKKEEIRINFMAEELSKWDNRIALYSLVISTI
ncbi:hypothetical protein NQ318_003737 [Aromia moschata]|uniref:Uncharacterized protein n=1 Tax=Aromia moschata TaxID=1265417 RepID=A0AAV8XGN1_9CUCU|nr:hypothetical protein NQ318_003737 [Aromia moschata]